MFRLVSHGALITTNVLMSIHTARIFNLCRVYDPTRITVTCRLMSADDTHRLMEGKYGRPTNSYMYFARIGESREESKDERLQWTGIFGV